MTTDIQNLKSFDPFAEAEDSVGDQKTASQNYIHIRIQRKFLPPFAEAHFLQCVCAAACTPHVLIICAQSAMVARP